MYFSISLPNNHFVLPERCSLPVCIILYHVGQLDYALALLHRFLKWILISILILNACHEKLLHVAKQLHVGISHSVWVELTYIKFMQLNHESVLFFMHCQKSSHRLAQSIGLDILRDKFPDELESRWNSRILARHYFSLGWGRYFSHWKWEIQILWQWQIS